MSPDAFGRLRCGWFRLEADETIAETNQALQAWQAAAGPPKTLEGLLSKSSYLYWQTACIPLLHSQGFMEDVALEVQGPDGAIPTIGNLVRNGEAIEGVLMKFEARRKYEQAIADAKLAVAEKEQEIDTLKKLSRMRLDFLNAATHELATPLTPIELHLSVLGGAVNSSQGDRSVQAIKKNLRRLQVFIENLHKAARVASAPPEVLREPIDLRAMAESMAGGVEIEGPDVEAYADRHAVREAIKVLLDNAHKFGKGTAIQIKLTKDPPAIHIQDQGIGIDPASLEKLGNPFYTAHDMQDVTSLGAGLGIFIARAGIEACGGTLSFASDGPNKGTTATIALKPVEAETGPSRTPMQQSQGPTT